MKGKTEKLLPNTLCFLLTKGPHPASQRTACSSSDSHGDLALPAIRVLCSLEILGITLLSSDPFHGSISEKKTPKPEKQTHKNLKNNPIYNLQTYAITSGTSQSCWCHSSYNRYCPKTLGACSLYEINDKHEDLTVLLY